MQELLPLIAVGGVIALLFAVLLRIQRRGRSRGRSALGPFLRHFERQGVPPELAAVAFRQLQRWMAAQDRSFAVKPEQSLSTVYGLVPEEVDAALERLAAECGRRRDPEAPRRRLETVSDLVLELARWSAA